VSNCFSNFTKRLGRLALLGAVLILNACGGGDNSGASGSTTNPTAVLGASEVASGASGSTTNPTAVLGASEVASGASGSTTNPTAVLGASEVAPVSGQTTVVGVEAGGVAFAEGDAAQDSKPTLTRVKNADLSTLFDSEKSTLMTEDAADYEILIKFPAVPTKDTTITVTVPDSLAINLTDSNAVVAYLIKGDIEQPSPFLPLASDYDPITKKLAFVLPEGHLSESTAGSGAAGQATIKIGLATAFGPESSVSGIQAKSLGTSAFQTTPTAQKLPCPVFGADGCIETSRMGPRVGGSSDYHYGVDFQADNPTALYAVSDGVIQFPEGSKWGTVDIVSGRTRYRYLHLSERWVKNGEKVLTGELIGLSGNTAPPTKPVSPHLHFEIWRTLPLPTVSKKAKWIVSKVDPFPYFLDKVGIDIPGQITPNCTTVGKSFALELRGYDINGTAISTKINNNGSFISKLRAVNWTTSTGTFKKQEGFINATHPLLGSYQKGLDPAKRNLVDITMPSSDVSATITAAWEGVSPEAKYSLNTAIYIPKPSFFPITVAVTENWPSDGIYQWSVLADNPYNLAGWMGLDTLKVFSKDCGGMFTYSETARRPATTTGNHTFDGGTATVSNGILAFTFVDQYSSPPSGTWNGAKSYLSRYTTSITYDISSGVYTYNFNGGQYVIDNTGKSHSSVATGSKTVVVPIVVQ
jgi:murein DD-endopeptidase MepM/ murein hydrolase activator NlpD